MLASAAAAGHGKLPSRAPDDGCRWKNFRSEALGVSLLVEDCAGPYAHYEYSVVGHRIEQHRPADDRTYVGPRMLEVYTKPASTSIEQAIAERFIAKLPREARLSCKVVPYRDRGDTHPRYTIAPTGAYKRKIHAELARYPRDFGCGPHGMGQEDTYFEYHPEESLEQFAFVDAGQDQPLFDQESIRFER